MIRLGSPDIPASMSSEAKHSPSPGGAGGGRSNASSSQATGAAAGVSGGVSVSTKHLPGAPHGHGGDGSFYDLEGRYVTQALGLLSIDEVS